MRGVLGQTRAPIGAAGLGRSFGFTPKDISGLVDWHRADLIAPADLSAGKVVTWRDQSGQGHDLTQSTDSNRPTQELAVIGPHPVVRFGPGFTANRWMLWTPWAKSDSSTVFAVVKHVVSDSDFQTFIGTQITENHYLGDTPTNPNKPMTFSGSTRARWGSALVGGTVYLVKWAIQNLTSNPRTYYTQVNRATEVSEAVAAAGVAQNNRTLGMDPAVAATQDLVSDVAELIIYNRRLAAGEEAAIRGYVSARYAIAM